MLTKSIALPLLAVSMLAACGSAPTARRYDDVLANNPQSVEIEIFGDVIHACGLESSKTYFSYASVDLSDDDKQLLSSIATCLSTGRLAGKSILVTGYTDDTGTAQANTDLGMSRSQIVALELCSRGVPAGHLFLRSRGERLAQGDDAVGRALDRKVELRVVEREM